MKKFITLALVASIVITALMAFGMVAVAEETVDDPTTFAAPTEPLVITNAESGYYAKTRMSDPEAGEIVFNAYINTTKYPNMTKFGIYFYKTAEEDSKVSVQSADLRTLKNYKGYFNASVYNIAPKHFEDIIIAIPYVVVNNEIITGSPFSIAVDDGDYVKWLGPKNN